MTTLHFQAIVLRKSTDQQKVKDEPDIVEDTAEILTPEKSDNDGNKTMEKIDQMLRN